MQNNTVNPIDVERSGFKSRKSFARRFLDALFSSPLNQHTSRPERGAPHLPGQFVTADRAGIDAAIWQTYVSEALDFDKSLIASWNEDLDVLLIFAGLFSAVLTTFVVESRKDLQEDYNKTSADLLRILVDPSQRTTTPTQFRPSLSSLIVNSLWFASLTCSLIGAVAAMLGKQWVRQYTNNLLVGGGHRVRARRHQFALIATKRWRMSEVIRMIPLFMHIALLLFLSGLIIFLWNHNTAVVGTAMTISLVGVFFYVILTILPSICSDCPFGTPFTNLLPKFSHGTLQIHDDHPLSRNDLDTKCLGWLLQSTSTNVVRSAAMAISGLEGTVSQHKILSESGALEVIAKAILSCTFEENGLLIIKHEDLDVASLLLFAALRLLNTLAYPPTQSHQALINVLRRFNQQKLIGLRETFNAADFAAAIWCLVAFNALRPTYSAMTTPKPFACEFIEIVPVPRELRSSATSRFHRDLLHPTIELAHSVSQDNLQLFAWAVKAMFVCWRNEGLPVSFGELGNSVISRAIQTKYPMSERSVLITIMSDLKIQDKELLSMGAFVPLVDAVKSHIPDSTLPAISILQCCRDASLFTFAMRPLIEAIGSADTLISVRSMETIAGKLDNSVWHTFAITSGILEALEEAMKSTEPSKVSAAMTTFGRTVDYALKSEVTATAKLVRSLVRIVDAKLDSITPTHLSWIFEILTRQANCATSIEAGAVQIFMKAGSLTTYDHDISSPEITISHAYETFSQPLITKDKVVMAMTAFAIIAKSHGFTVATTDGAIRTIIDAMKSNRIGIAAAAGQAFAKIARHDIGLKPIVTTGLIIPLAQAMMSRFTFVQDLAFQILETIFSYQSSDSAITRDIRLLLEGMDSQIPDSAILSISTLGFFSRHEKGAAMIIAAGAISLLVEALRNPEPRCTDAVLTTLESISTHEIGIDAVTAIDHESVKFVITKAAHHNRFNIINKLSMRMAGMNAIITSDALAVLVNTARRLAKSKRTRKEGTTSILEVFLKVSEHDSGLRALITAGAQLGVFRKNPLALELNSRIASVGFGGKQDDNGLAEARYE